MPEEIQFKMSPPGCTLVELVRPSFLSALAPTMALPFTKPLQDGALDGVSEASSMERQGCCPLLRATWVD